MNSHRNFNELLRSRWQDADTLVCVGLDPDPSRFPVRLGDDPQSIATFLISIVDATAEFACAFKPQIAHFAAASAESALHRVIDHIRARHENVPVILDAKRGDIGSTANHYANEAFDRYRADAVTVNPYLGGDTLEPFLARADRGVIVLCRTSNPGSGDLQSLQADGKPVYLHVAERAARDWNGNGNCCLVVGATWPQELGAVRKLAPTLPILVPGIGAQGGDLSAVLASGLDASGAGLMINSSRAILYASSGADFASAAGDAARELRDAINRLRDAVS